MNAKTLFTLGLVLVAVLALSGCGMLGGGDPNANPTPTLPFPTPIVVNTAAAGETAAPPQEGPIFVGGEVFNDANGDGEKNQGDSVIAGVVVQLAAGECPGAALGQTASTVDTPSYRFDGLQPGDYCVSIDAASPENSAVLGQGEWTLPEKMQGTISNSVRLTNRSRPNQNFGWTFASLGGGTPVPAETTVAQPSEPTTVPILPTPTQFVEPTAPASGGQACTYRANYIADVTIPDGTIVASGVQFVKTWRVLNSGTCPWGPGTTVQNMQFINGNPLGAPNLVPIPNQIAAGAQGDISISMTAPAQAGAYRSSWKLRADNGQLIGVGQSSVSLFASIRVQVAAPPTAVPPPTSPAPPSQVIQMAPGATEAEAQGQLPANGIATYSVGAQANQNMQLSLSSNSQSARISVLAPNGVPLPPQRGNPEGTYWQGNLPANGNYTIQVLAGNAATTANFSLNVTIPVRITFQPGGISASVRGVTSNGRIVTYLLKANGGQNMTANLVAPANSAGITIYGLEDGQPLIRSQSGATSFDGQLPATQDYVIQVVPFGNTQVNYTLEITVQ